MSNLPVKYIYLTHPCKNAAEPLDIGIYTASSHQNTMYHRPKMQKRIRVMVKKEMERTTLMCQSLPRSRCRAVNHGLPPRCLISRCSYPRTCPFLAKPSTPGLTPGMSLLYWKISVTQPYSTTLFTDMGGPKRAKQMNICI